MSRYPSLMFLIVVSVPIATESPAFAADPAIFWKKTVLDTQFRSEGVAVADVNRDGKMDVLVGEFWYEAPNWTRHEMQKPGNYGDGLNGYSKVFACWAEDLNADGYPDLIVIDFPGLPCYWLENPKGLTTTAEGKPVHWKRHTIWHSACNETPVYTDQLIPGKKVLLMGFQPPGKEREGQMAYFTPNPKDPYSPWIMHPVSEPSTPPEIKDGKPVPGTGKEIPGTFKFSHGLGVGDINGDGRADVIVTAGWWEQPEQLTDKPWRFHSANLGDPAADLFAVDIDGDGYNDVLSTSAHKFGIWYHRQRPAATSEQSPTFEKVVLFPELVSETHAAHFVDIDGDGLKDLVTGKRKYSHGLREPGAAMPATIYWLKATRQSDGSIRFIPQVIDEDSGIGTQFQVVDVNGDGLLDVVTSNKKGVHMILQQRK